MTGAGQLLQILVALQSSAWVVCYDTESDSSQGRQLCKCVAHYQCNYQIPTDSSGHLEISVNTEGCSEPLDVCCPLESIRTLPAATCGLSQTQDLSLRITADSQAGFAQFPWMTALLGPGRIFLCGGSLIHPQVVLTAAHCVNQLSIEDVTIRVGEWDSQAKTEPLPVQNRAVIEILVHEQFTAGSLLNDIALLFLDSGVKLADNVGTICLPSTNEPIAGRTCLASGWGKDALGPEGRHSTILRSVELPIVPREECQEMLRRTKLGHHFHLHESFICAGGREGEDTCNGDGGGPLVCARPDDPSVYEQAGIVAWGIGCGGSVPAAYTNVALFRNWLDLQILKHGLSL